MERIGDERRKGRTRLTEHSMFTPMRFLARCRAIESIAARTALQFCVFPIALSGAVSELLRPVTNAVTHLFVVAVLPFF